MISVYQSDGEHSSKVDMALALKVECPINSRPRFLAPTEKKVANRKIKEWLKERKKE